MPFLPSSRHPPSAIHWHDNVSNQTNDDSVRLPMPHGINTSVSQQPPMPHSTSTIAHGGSNSTMNHMPHQQQFQSATVVAAHHNTNNNAAAYYQQAAHIYPNYHGQQDHQQQQQGVPDHHNHQHHHHNLGTSVSSTNTAATSVLNTSVAAAAQQHVVGGGQASGTLNHHAGWSPAGVSSMAAAPNQAHHAVATDHSALAYITHAYQSHSNSGVSDHHRNSTVPMTSIGSAAQAHTYTVDTLYSTSAAAAAAAAYGYNNYNAAFFQTSNNGPHAQAGHPSQASLTTFWNQHGQQRSTHSQSMPNQAGANIQQRQHQMASDPPNTYLNDPRVYGYGRPHYTQNTGQNFGIHQQADMHQTHQHQRMSANLSDQHSVIQHHHTDLSQHSHLHQADQQASSNQNVHQQLSLTTNMQHSQQQMESDNRKFQSAARITQQDHQIRSTHFEEPSPVNKDLDKRPSDQVHKKTIMPSKNIATIEQVDNRIGVESSKNQVSTSSMKSASPINKTQTVIKSETQMSQYNARKSGIINQSSTNSSQPGPQTRNTYRDPPEMQSKKYGTDLKDSSRPSTESTTKTNQSLNIGSNEDQITGLDDSMKTLSIGQRKTTWASIASQPAKVSQPKSLKSKIAGSNSALSTTNKHLTTSVTIDSSSLDSKNGIHPAIKSSVSAASTSIVKSTASPIAKVASAAVASLKLDLLGEDSSDSKISWPAVNASINLTLEDSLPTKPVTSDADTHRSNASNDRMRKDDGFRTRDVIRDRRDHNHNHHQGPNSTTKFMNNSDWQRREHREYRLRRDSDRRGDDIDRRVPPNEYQEDLREQINSRRDYKQPNRSAHFRHQDDPGFRDFRRENQRFSGRVSDNPRDMPHHGNNSRQNESAPHHHYNNLRDRDARNQQAPSKFDLNVHPHLNPDNFNPKTFDCDPSNARFFIIKSYSEDDVHRSIKYSVWCSTNHGNKRLDEAYKQQQARDGQLYLFFSVNGSGHFCGMAQMTSSVDFESSTGIWAQSKWQGEFNVKWIYVKDVPNGALRHITLENNEDKPVTNSRDTQEVPYEKGKAVLKIIHQYPLKTSLFDAFLHYERRQEEEKVKKSSTVEYNPQIPPASREPDRDRISGPGRFGRSYVNSRSHHDFSGRDRPARYA